MMNGQRALSGLSMRNARSNVDGTDTTKHKCADLAAARFAAASGSMSGRACPASQGLVGSEAGRNSIARARTHLELSHAILFPLLLLLWKHGSALSREIRDILRGAACLQLQLRLLQLFVQIEDFSRRVLDLLDEALRQASDRTNVSLAEVLTRRSGTSSSLCT
jgi:hypothetical protein